MSIFKRLNAIAQRSSLFGTVLALVAATVVPALVPLSTYADTLNPLTDRSLTLSSSSPGWAYTDGSGNSTYAPPNSGANGQKTGNTFSFKVSTDTSVATGDGNSVLGFSFQYCIAAAGACVAPGDGSAAGESNLNIHLSNPEEVSNAIGTYIDSTTGNVKKVPAANDTEGNFAVAYYDATANSGAGGWVQSTGWDWTTANNEQSDGTHTVTGENNYSILVDDGDGATGLQIPTGTQVKVFFFGTDSNYITNPGSGAFFVKINDYKTATLTQPLNGTADSDFNQSQIPTGDVIDGGVTVANVMNQSIEIQTKVLETMDFSVGTVDPDTLNSANGPAESAPTDPTGDGHGADSTFGIAMPGHTSHGICDPILSGMAPGDAVNTLILGDETAENSLSTAHTYSTHSYFRLSSNSSKGAVVYYSGATLSDTEGDQIAPMGATYTGNTVTALNPTTPAPGTAQFGLALDNSTSASSYGVDYGVERTAASGTNDENYGVFEDGADNTTNGISSSLTDDLTTAGSLAAYHAPALAPLAPDTVSLDGNATAATAGTFSDSYGQGTGYINSTYAVPNSASVNTKFAFDPQSETTPTPLASESQEVVDCVTGKVRYVANIAATTPAGIYTTKINYIAAPQY